MAQGPPGGVIGILGGVVAIGLIVGVAVTVFMVHRRQQKTRTETDNDLTDLPPAHKPAPPPPKKKNSDMKGHLTSDDIQDSGMRPEELLNPAEYMSYQRVCNMEPFPESQPAPTFPPTTFLPQHPYAQHPPNEPTYSNTSFPAPGPGAPFTFPKEQSV
ncbi:cyclin-K-like isoform X3 [Anarrhichthys ocellatus]|uniref:cyclin-K-like isoform X3 n=1 Tax=Anarrhichthys ocellatus TaxID=433405 RepID=UPI0012EE062C|nr:cyclin-K-like isoform X3 [Anarrhichthys ocellatus]